MIYILLPDVLERMMNAHTTESENTDTHVFSVYISIASVNENLVRSSAQLRMRSASAEYSALPCVYSSIMSTSPFFLFIKKIQKSDPQKKKKKGTSSSNQRPCLSHAVTRASKILGGVK